MAMRTFSVAMPSGNTGFRPMGPARPAGPPATCPCRRSCPCGSPCSKPCGGGNHTHHSSHQRAGGHKGLAPPPEALGIYYSTSTGHTQEVADLIKEALGDVANEPKDIGDVEDLATELTHPSLEGLIVGAPTWVTGAAEGRSGTAWDDALANIAALDLAGRKVAVFGCGDAEAYGDYFCDAMEELYNTFSSTGATMVGAWPTEGYRHSESKAEVQPDQFCGLALDQDNQDDLTEGRVKQWVAQLLKEMKP